MSFFSSSLLKLLNVFNAKSIFLKNILDIPSQFALSLRKMLFIYQLVIVNNLRKLDLLADIQINLEKLILLNSQNNTQLVVRE